MNVLNLAACLRLLRFLSLLRLVCLVSEGQRAGAVTDQELTQLAARHACRGRKGPKKRRFKLAQDLAGVQERIGRGLVIAELKIAAYEWYRLSEPYLDQQETRDDHLMSLIAETERCSTRPERA